MPPTPKTLLFYDLETTGLSHCFDQVLEFAAVRADMDLNEIDRTHFFVRLRNDIVPAPEAVLITEYDVENVPPNALSEYDAACIIHELFNTPGTITIGYNSLTFDDEILRFLFYRNLLTPYTHQYANDCGRADLFPITVVYYLFHSNIMRWGEDSENGPSLKLANLGELNGLFTGKAHSALYDTLAALKMARLFRDQHQKTWDYLLGRFNKDKDKEEIAKLDGLAYAVDTKYGYKDNFIGEVLDIGTSLAYKNQNLWLRLDGQEISTTTLDNIADTTFVIRKRYGDVPFILPPYPRYGEKITPERKQLAQENLAWLQSHPDIFAAVKTYHQNFRYPEAENVDADAKLYIDGFKTRADEEWCKIFHEAPPANKGLVIAQIKSPTVKELGLRVMGRNFYDELDEKTKKLFDKHLAAANSLNGTPPNDYRNTPRLSISGALAQIEELLKSELSQKEQDLMAKLKKWLTKKAV